MGRGLSYQWYGLTELLDEWAERDAPNDPELRVRVARWLMDVSDNPYLVGSAPVPSATFNLRIAVLGGTEVSLLYAVSDDRKELTALMLETL